MTSGSRRSTIIRRPASRPAATSGNSSARNSRVSGSRVIRIVASVMMPKVPSEPRNSRMKSGPDAWFGTPGVRISVPVRQRDLDAHHEVLGLAVLGADRARAARREIAAERGALRRRRIVRQRQAAIVQRPLEHRAVDAGLRPHRQRRLVDLEDPIEPLEVDDDAVVDRQRAALRARAAAPRQRPAPARGARSPGRARPPRRCPDGR